MPRVLLLLPTTTYRSADFLEAAAKLGVEVAVASEEANALEAVNPAGLLTLDRSDPGARARPFDAVVGVDDDTAVTAAAIARALGLPHNPVPAAAAARHKGQMRDRLSAAGVPVPRHRVFRRADGPESAAASVRYPCVLKP